MVPLIAANQIASPGPTDCWSTNLQFNAIGRCTLNGFSQAHPLDCWYNTEVGRVEVVGETSVTLNYTLAKVFFARRITKSAIGS